MDRNTALEETQIRWLQLRTRKSLWLLKNDFLPVPYKSYKEMYDKSTDLKGQRLHFQIISTANGRPFPLRFSSEVSVVQKLNVGFANTVYFTEIQHYKQQAMLCREWAVMRPCCFGGRFESDGICLHHVLPAPHTHTPARWAGHQSLSGPSPRWTS